MTSRPRLIIVGGFLGAGKTTAIRRLARHLADQGLRVGLITNDQAADLVDTGLLRACGFTTEEIAGGCFCCRFDDLIAATGRLAADQPPDWFIAEAVGSCTDLVATVLEPVHRLHPDRFTVGPLTVVVDPIRARRALGLDPQDEFSDDVGYVYRKQLEEAELLVVNKADLISAAEWTELERALDAVAPRADRFLVSAREGSGLDRWFRAATEGHRTQRTSMAVDYDKYASGEACLGWVNATIAATADPPIGGDLLIGGLATALHRRLATASAPIAHLKVSLTDHHGGFGAISLVRADALPDLTFDLADPVAGGQLTVNLRAEAAPERLVGILHDSMAALIAERPSLHLETVAVQAFRPGRPTPTHRDRTP